MGCCSIGVKDFSLRACHGMKIIRALIHNIWANIQVKLGHPTLIVDCMRKGKKLNSRLRIKVDVCNQSSIRYHMLGPWQNKRKGNSIWQLKFFVFRDVVSSRLFARILRTTGSYFFFIPFAFLRSVASFTLRDNDPGSMGCSYKHASSPFSSKNSWIFNKLMSI